MDWKKTFNRGQWVIHGVFVLAIILGVGSTLFAIRLNNLQGQEEERNLKISSLLSYLQSDKSFEKIGKSLTWANPQKANDKLRELTSKVVETEELLELKTSDDLGLALRTFNRLINNNSSMSNPADALKVLLQKVNQLKSVAETQNYKNVAIISERMKERLSELNAKNAGSSPQIANLRSDLKRLETLVSGSSLTEGEKSGLLTRIQSMTSEIELLSSLNSHSKDLKAHVNQGSLAMGQWVLEAEKRAGELKGVRGDKQNQLIIFLASLVGFIITAWMGIAYMFRWQKLKIGDQVEGEVKSVIEKGIMADQRFMLDHYTDTTREQVIKLLDELKVKLNLGTMLHNGLPFAGCMIDNTFRLTWFNHLFLEQFYLSEEEVRSEAFNWDYLREYLNLADDPVYEAMVNKIAGIYPVKMKQDELTPMQPFEMYVTPISVNREDRVMVFFYPLVSAREAIVEQVGVTKASINRFLELWNEEKLSEDEIRLLEKDFKINDISDLYESLVVLHERLNGEKAEYIRTIRSLEKENADYQSTLDEIKRLEEERKELIKCEFNLAGELKQAFISSLERSESLLQINRTILQQNDEFKTEAQKMQLTVNESQKKTRETLEILTQLDGVRTDYKKLKLELLEVKAKLITIHSSLMGQMPALDEHQQKLANRYKDELARLDFNVVTLDKKLGQLDVMLAKMQMMHDKHPVEQTNFNFQTSQKDHELRDAILEIQRSLGSEEGRIIEHFKFLHQLMKSNLNKNSEVHNISATIIAETHSLS